MQYTSSSCCCGRGFTKYVKIATTTNGSGFEIPTVINWSDAGCRISTRRIRWIFKKVTQGGNVLVHLFSTTYHLISDSFPTGGTYNAPQFINGYTDVYGFLTTNGVVLSGDEHIIVQAEIRDCSGATKLSNTILVKPTTIVIPTANWRRQLFTNVPAGTSVTSAIPLPSNLMTAMRVFRDGLLMIPVFDFSTVSNTITPTIPFTGVESIEIFIWQN